MLRPFALLAAVMLATPAGAEPANNFNAMFASLNACMAPLRLTKGTDVTILFSLNRRGGVIGKPRLTHVRWGEGADPKREAASIAASFERCLPAEISDALGAAIAGRLFTYRLRGGAPDART